jgi:hypothetical protein
MPAEGVVWLDYQQTASYIHKSVPWIRARRHEIPHSLIGRRVLFRKSDLDKYIASHRVKTARSA